MREFDSMRGHYRPKQFHGKPSMTREQGKTQMLMFLFSCHDSALEKITPQELVSRHKVNLREAVEELRVARYKRGMA